MSGKLKQRSSANAAEEATTSLNEKILKQCHVLYTDGDSGLIKVAGDLGLSLLPPRKKITVMLMGNHSAGKSSFINWYVEEHLQRTGVAIETQGFTFVTSGRKRESLTGNATLHLYPHFKALQNFEGVSEYLCTEISTSKQKKFSLVTFIDTPGLVDGDMKYPFDVDKALLGLGELSDLLFVFFDPMGQALCKRTLNIVERLNENHGEKIRFYLSKADEAGSESDRQRVMMQIVQELCKRPGLNKCGFDMPTIYIPNPNKPSRCVNQIEEVCKSIEKTINQTIQNTLNTLEKDCELIASTIDRKLHNDREASKHNRTARCKGLLLGILSLALPTMLFANFLLASVGQEVLASVLGRETLDTVRVGLAPLAVIWDWIHEENHTFFILGVVVFSLILLFIAKYICRSQVTFSSRERRQLEEKRTYVQTVVKQKKLKYYKLFLSWDVRPIHLD
uniref:Si:ch211-11k18.4 n=1 Tax=Petromyzon marinus TaxID=7757 RepID=S4RP39_PETMA